MKSRVVFSLLLVGLFVLTSIGASMGNVYAQDGNQPVKTSVEEVSPYLTIRHLTYADGTQIDGYGIHGPSQNPSGIADEELAAITPLPSEGKILASFPSFSWVFGCSAVSASMIATYYDRKAYTNLYMGPTAGGKMPVTDTSWPTWTDGSTTYPNNPLIASKQGVDGRTTKGSINDYWIKYGSTAADPYITGGWTQHAWATSVGDFMKTSQSKYGSTDGSTWFYNYNDATKLTCADMEKYTDGAFKISELDGTYGRKLFYQKRGYTVGECYNQRTYPQTSGGYTLAKFKAEIDAGHPVFINVTGHSMVAYGYGTGSTIYIRNTWDSNTAHTYTMPWGGEYKNMQMYAVSIVKLGPAVIPNPITPTGKISDKTPTYSWSYVKNATDYRFVLYKKGVSAPKYTVTVTKAAACGTSTTTCKKTPGVSLASGEYRWKVQAKIGGVWKNYSDYKNFTEK